MGFWFGSERVFLKKVLIEPVEITKVVDKIVKSGLGSFCSTDKFSQFFIM